MADPDAQIIHAETQIGGSSASVDESSIDECVAEADRIWSEIQESGIAPEDDEGNDTLFKAMRARHHNFAMTFPMVLRWAVQMREYSQKIARRYFVKVAKVGGVWPERKDFLESQVDYLVMLYKHRNPRASVGQLQHYRKFYSDQLRQEDKEFDEEVDAAKEEAETIEKNAEKALRERLYLALVRQRAAASSAKP